MLEELLLLGDQNSDADVSVTQRPAVDQDGYIKLHET